jgi:hypothetical protein
MAPSRSVGDESNHRASHSYTHHEIEPLVLFFPYLPGERSRDQADKCQHHLGATHPVFPKGPLKIAPLFWGAGERSMQSMLMSPGQFAVLPPEMLSVLQ